MRILTGISCMMMGALAAQAGILPEFDAQALARKQPTESVEQRLRWQVEEPRDSGPTQQDAAAPTPFANLAPREASIAQRYLEFSARSGGQFYNALEQPLPQVLDELLNAQLVDGADIVFLVDHTSSMEDDIDEIRQELQHLIATFQQRQGVRVGLVTFSDVKSGSRFGYYAHPLSADYSGLQAYLERVELLGSIEDVYGAIAKTVQEFEWESASKRLIVIISDEQPATGADTNYTEEQVLALCAKAGVKTNLYPVLVDKYLPVK